MSKITLETPTLVLGSGIASSGKTTVLKELVKHVNDSFIIDKDIINQTLLLTIGSANGVDAYRLNGPQISVTDEFYQQNVKFQTYQCMLELARNNLELGKHAMIDGNYTKEIRNSYLDKILFPFLRHVSHKTKIVFCYADEETIKRRMKERSSARDLQKIISQESWERFLVEQPILPPELEKYNHIKVDTSKPLESNVPMVLDYLKS